MEFTLHHNLRNSVSGILSASQSLQDDLPEALGNHKILIRAIQQSCQSMLQLLDDELQPAGKRSSNCTCLTENTLISLIRQQLAQNAPLAGRKEIELALVTTRDLPEIQVNAPEISLLLNDLIRNAISVARPRSRVELRVVKSGQVMMSVQDTGERPPVEQAKAGSKATLGGMPLSATTPDGAGLAILTRALVNQNGYLQADNEVKKGLGLTVRVTFATSKGPGRARRAPRPARLLPR